MALNNVHRKYNFINVFIKYKLDLSKTFISYITLTTLISYFPIDFLSYG